MTLYSDVIKVEISDSDQNKINASGIPNLATIAFTVDSLAGKNITCAYLNEDTNEWLLGSDGNLTVNFDNKSN